MKKYNFFIAAALLISATACSVKVSHTDDKEEAAAQETLAASGKTAKVTDPVCGMEKENTWTDHTVTGTDTSWFCSPHCKETFAKNPEKYLKKTEDKKG